jgi:polar amino acid transport system substrate-binding protein
MQGRAMIRALTVFAALTALSGFINVVSADEIDDIKARNKLIVGVKADYKPFGFPTQSGMIVGFEPDLAADVAKRLGVGLELVPVQSANRIDFLKQGKIDLIIATMADTPERRKIVQIIDPDYYADFGNVMLRKSVQAKSWEDLQGKRICATSGALYNKPMTEKYHFDLVAFEGSDRPLLALKEGDCAGYLFDQGFIAEKLTEDEWKTDFYMPLPGEIPAPWGIAARLEEPRFKDFLEKVLVDWAKTGFILEEEKKWQLPANEFTQQMHEKYKDSKSD